MMFVQVLHSVPLEMEAYYVTLNYREINVCLN